MNVLALVACAGTLAMTALAQESAAKFERTTTSFSLTVKAPYEEAAPLFGPQGERAWAGPHWNPEFLYPRPASDIEGAVFTIRHGALNATWVNTLFDLPGRHFQYVYFLPKIMVTVIDVRFESPSAETTAVNVTYTRTALTESGNEQVRTMTAFDNKAAPEWQDAIEHYLASKKSQRNP